MSFDSYEKELEARNDILPLGKNHVLQFEGETLEYTGLYFSKGLGRNDVVFKYSGDGAEVHYSPVTNQFKLVRGTDVLCVDIDGLADSGEVVLCR